MTRITGTDKKTLRREALAVRAGLPMESLSHGIRSQIAAWQPFLEAETVLIYHPFRNEVDLLPLVDAFPAKRWALPRMDADHALHFHAFVPGDPLETHGLGMREPAPAAAQIDPASRLLVFAPALLADRRGYRLGYGKGVYDRTLAGLRDATVVVALPDALVIDALPVDDWDHPVDWVITERETVPGA